MTSAPLHHRLLDRVAEIARRSDVTVHELDVGSHQPIGRWTSILPADMFAFYDAIDGLMFSYSFAGDHETWHGLEFLTLGNDGASIFRRRGQQLEQRLPRGPLRSFPAQFFHDPPGAEAMMFFGSDDSAGLIMFGAGDNASFHRWTNGGELTLLGRGPGAFAAIVERMIANGFAHTWDTGDHPNTAAVVARLQQPAPMRATFTVEVTAREDIEPSAYRRAMFAECSEARRDQLLRALKLAARNTGASSDDQIAMLDEACRTTASISDATANAVMKVFGFRNQTRERFAAFMLSDLDAVARVRLKVTSLATTPDLPFRKNPEMFTRVLHAIDGLQITADAPIPAASLHWMAQPEWSPFLACKWDFVKSFATEPTAKVELMLPRARAIGLVKGKRYTSTALPRTLP